MWILGIILAISIIINLVQVLFFYTLKDINRTNEAVIKQISFHQSELIAENESKQRMLDSLERKNKKVLKPTINKKVKQQVITKHIIDLDFE